MSLFGSPEEHAANPPESWVVSKVADRCWRLGPKHGGTLGIYPRKRDAEEHKTTGFYVDLYNKETRWYAGEPVPGWKPYRAQRLADDVPPRRAGPADHV